MSQRTDGRRVGRGDGDGDGRPPPGVHPPLRARCGAMHLGDGARWCATVVLEQRNLGVDDEVPVLDTLWSLR